MTNHSLFRLPRALPGLRWLIVLAGLWGIGITAWAAAPEAASEPPPQEQIAALREASARHMAAGEFTEAIERLEEALSLLPTAAVKDRAEILQAMTRAHVRNEDVRSALTAIEASRQLAFSTDDPLLKADSMLLLGAVYVTLRDYENALTYVRQALDLAEQSGVQTAIAGAINTLAVIYWQMEDFALSEAYLRRALDLAAEDASLRHKIINNIGVALIEQGRFEEAGAELVRARAYFEEAADRYFLAIITSNFAHLAEQRGQLEEALRHSEAAIATGEAIGNLYVQVRTLRHQGNAHAQLEDWAAAEASFERSIDLARQMGDPAEEMRTWRRLIALFEENGRYREALEAHRALQQIESEILSKQVRYQGIHFEIQYQTARQAQEIAMLQQENQLAALAAERERLEVERAESDLQQLGQKQRADRFQRNLIFFGFLLAIMLLGLLYSRFRFRQRAFRQIAAQRDELEANRRSLQRANDELRALNQEKDEILGIAAHDLQTPLTAQRGFAEVLAEDWGRLAHAEVMEFTSAIVTATETMQEIIQNLLESHRLEQGAVVLDQQPIDPRTAMEASLEALRHQAKAKHQQIELELPAALPMVSLDRHYFERILQNLLSNAVKYSPPSTRIRVLAEVGAQEFTLSVQDQGPGIPPEEQPRLFQKFARLSPQTTAGEASTGLGLSIVKRLVELHGGTVACQSKPGHGATFSLRFPLAAQQDEAKKEKAVF